MKKKNILSGVLCICMLSSSAFAVNTVSATQPNSASVSKTATVTYEPVSAATESLVTASPTASPYYTGVRGTIISIEADNEMPMIEIKTATTESLVLLVGKDTVFADNRLGTLCSITDLKVNDEIYAYTDPSGECTVSTFAILNNLEDGPITKMHKIEGIRYKGNHIEANCDHGSITINTSTVTEYRPNHVNQTVNADNLQAGSSFLAWYNALDAERLGQVTATRILPLPDYTAVQTKADTPYYVGTRGVVTSMETSENPIMIEVQTDTTSSLVLQVDSNTALINNQLGTPVSVSDIKVGDTIYAYTDPSGECTVSTFAILTNLGSSSVAQMHKAENVNLATDNAVASCDHSSIIVRTDANTELKSYQTGQSAAAQDLRANTAFLEWHSTITSGNPDQVTASRIVILPDYSTKPAAANANVQTASTVSAQSAAASQFSGMATVKIGDTEFEAKKNGNSYQVPVRTVAEALGVTVDWVKEGSAGFIFLRNYSGVLSMAIGKNDYTYLSSASGTSASAQTLSIAPHYDSSSDGTVSTWIDADAFKMMGFPISTR